MHARTHARMHGMIEQLKMLAVISHIVRPKSKVRCANQLDSDEVKREPTPSGLMYWIYPLVEITDGFKQGICKIFALIIFSHLARNAVQQFELNIRINK